MKKIISIILILSIMTVFVIPASAFEQRATEELVGSADVILELSTVTFPGDIKLVIAEDNNGATTITQYFDDELVETVYVEANTDEIVITNVNGEESTIMVSQASSTSGFSSNLLGNSTNLLAAAANTYKGEITFQTMSGYEKVKVYYGTSTMTTGYNIYGTYSSLAAFVGVLIAGLALPGVFASVLAAQVLAWCGFGIAVVSFTLPSKILQCSKYTIDWLFKNSANTSHTNTLSGSRYTITEDGNYTGEIYYDADYYPTSTWNNQIFGMTVYDRMFAVYPYSIYSWS